MIEKFHNFCAEQVEQNLRFENQIVETTDTPSLIKKIGEKIAKERETDLKLHSHP